MSREGRSPSQTWSRWGFVLAASGSAIGLGNVVFFPANAYRYGGGAFYLPYLVALVVIGLPLMILELGLGQRQRSAFPSALGQLAGRKGEVVGWWALINASILSCYYVTILAWVVGMLVGSLGPLWEAQTALPGFAVAALPNPQGYFFRMLSVGWPLAAVVLLWSANGWIVRSGTQSIERAVKVFVPAMWVLMIGLAIRGLTLPGGVDGALALFDPEPSTLADLGIWQGAIGQIFFTLTLGFGVMTAYASYLPDRSDAVDNGLVISFLNCGFEYVAGIAIFSTLFVFAAVPQASTLSMMFFVVPRGLAEMPGGPLLFGVLFFVLLLLAGLSSSVSLVEALVSAWIDKFGTSRRRTVLVVCGLGVLGSSAFALPQIVDPGLASDGTLGLTLLDLFDHWVFSYGLLIVGLAECVVLGWVVGTGPLIESLNAGSFVRLGRGFDVLVRFVIPGAILAVLVAGVRQEIAGGLYGASYASGYPAAWAWLGAAPLLALLFWLFGTTAGAIWLTTRPVGSRPSAPETGVEP